MLIDEVTISMLNELDPVAFTLAFMSALLESIDDILLEAIAALPLLVLLSLEGI